MKPLSQQMNGSLVCAPDHSNSYAEGGAAYPRILCLKHNGPSNGTLLCTYELYAYVNNETVWPIHRSTDHGATWQFVTNVRDTQYGLGNKLQPVLFELPQQMGDLPAGTLLIAGDCIPNDGSSTAIVIYMSRDCGASWAYLSTVDQGGPAVCDASAGAATTSIWEPFFGLDVSGNLVCYYSDERQKSNGIHQALVHRVSSDGGLSWGELVNDVAIANNNDRPGMITVTRLPNGRYFATYEVVNRPSNDHNVGPIYCKFSVDGVTWNADDIGKPLLLEDGVGIGAAPYCKWVPTEHPNGMIIVSAKWGVSHDGNIAGGQNFFVNYNLGEGHWERLPMAVAYHHHLAGYSHSFDTSLDHRTLYQATSVENVVEGLNEIRVGARPLHALRYEARHAIANNVLTLSSMDACSGEEIRFISSSSSIRFERIHVPASGTYKLRIRYSNGTTEDSMQMVLVNDGAALPISYPPTVDWERYLWVSLSIALNHGDNALQLNTQSGELEIDCIEIDREI